MIKKRCHSSIYSQDTYTLLKTAIFSLLDFLYLWSKPEKRFKIRLYFKVDKNQKAAFCFESVAAACLLPVEWSYQRSVIARFSKI